jgi:hypothetical protein
MSPNMCRVPTPLLRSPLAAGRRPSRCQQATKGHQRGVVMLFGLLAMVIMMIGAVALVRSMNTSLTNAGNLGFKRDLTNQGERATAMVLNALQAGALVNDTARQNSLSSSNYSATLLPSNSQGLPLALVDDALHDERRQFAPGWLGLTTGAH